MIHPTAPPPPVSPKDRALMQKAQELEASFLSEMLSFTGLGKSQGSFFGSDGEDQFASFMRDEQARLMVASGGIGLAEHLFHALARMNDAKP